VANPVQFDEQPFSISGAPECGQNTEEVLLELGLDWDDLARLKSEKAIL
jgi:crotonobetainyl-CoA:carnitine CoA-transferase CaiB-like acyl-CoA transferase